MCKVVSNIAECCVKFGQVHRQKKNVGKHFLLFLVSVLMLTQNHLAVDLNKVLAFSRLNEAYFSLIKASPTSWKSTKIAFFLFFVKSYWLKHQNHKKRALV